MGDGRLRQRLNARRKTTTNVDPPWGPARTRRSRKSSLSSAATPVFVGHQLQRGGNVKRTQSTGIGGPEKCMDCGRGYQLRTSLLNHLKYECGKDPQFKCPQCDYRSKLKGNIKGHVKRKHKADYAELMLQMQAADLGAVA